MRKVERSPGPPETRPAYQGLVRFSSVRPIADLPEWSPGSGRRARTVPVRSATVSETFSGSFAKDRSVFHHATSSMTATTPRTCPSAPQITHRERQGRPRRSHPDIIADQKPVGLERRHQIEPAAQRTAHLIGPAGADHGAASIRYRNGLFRRECGCGTVEECLATVSIAVAHFGGCGDQGRYLPDAVEDTRLFRLDRVAQLGRLRPHAGLRRCCGHRTHRKFRSRSPAEWRSGPE